MSGLSLVPGMIIVMKKGRIEHFAVVSDKKCPNGKLMLISARPRSSTVLEEAFDDVAKGNPIALAHRQPVHSALETLRRARRQIGKWKYNAVSANCEMFANWAAGHAAKSNQVDKAIGGGLLAASLVAAVQKTPTSASIVVAALVGCSIGLASAQIMPSQR